MAGTSFTANQPVHRAGLRATLRFRWKSDLEPVPTREIFGKTLLLGLLKLKVSDVLCLQNNSQERSFDVTFVTNASCERVIEESRRLVGTKPLSGFEVISLDRPNFRIITIHLYNPYVPDQAVAVFLGRYAEILTAPRMLNDSLGFWTGKRQYQVLLNEDAGGFEGYAHPPAFFSIGADRGYLFYSRQPPFCRKCKSHGHVEGACGLVLCRFCLIVGHAAKDCPEPKTCNICASTEHLARSCPKAGSTEADTVSRGRRPKAAEQSRALEGAAPNQVGSNKPGPPEGEVALQEALEQVGSGDSEQWRPVSRRTRRKRDLDNGREENQGSKVHPGLEVPLVVGKKAKKKVKRAKGEGAEEKGELQVQDTRAEIGATDLDLPGQVEMDFFHEGAAGPSGVLVLSAGSGLDFGGLSPLGLYPLHPSPAPNKIPYSWAEVMEDSLSADLYD